MKARIGILTVLLLSLCKIAYAQENYLAGFVIKTNQDTIRGYVDYRNWGVNPKSIQFKTALSEAATSFSPLEISSFQVGDEIYEGAIVDAEISANRDLLQDNAELQLQRDTVFLQTLFSGEKSLYYYRLGHTIDNFYIKQSTGFELLAYKKYTQVNKEGRKLILEKKKFIGQLVVYLSACEVLDDDIQNAKYTAASLTKIFQSYYRCTNDNGFFKKTREQPVFAWGALVGVSLSSLKFKLHPTLSQLKYKYSPNPVFGAYLDITLPRNQGRWSINNELMFAPYQMLGYAKISLFDQVYTTLDSKMHYSYLKLNNMARYYIPMGAFRTFINMGASTGVAVRTTDKFVIYDRFYEEEDITNTVTMPNPRLFELGYLVGAGTKISKLTFEARYESGIGMASLANANSASRRFYFLMGYSF